VKGTLVSLVVMAAAGYVLVAAAMFAMQRNLLYVPGSKTFEPPSAVGLAGFEPVTLTTADNIELKGWYSPPPHNPAPVFVYMHGNAGTLADRAERFELFRKEGFGVLAISWRGFGGSGGSPTEAGLLEDGRAALKRLQADGIGLERVVMFGESLGSGVAVQLAAQADTRPGALVLDAPFTSTADVARLRYGFLPVGLLMKDQFRSDLHAPAVSVPVMVLHGTADRVTPFHFGKQLSEMFAGPVTFMRLEGAPHIADLTPHSWGAIKAFLGEHGLLR
jgi:pimeloyl-ACP methyl ester carboxylesterase